MSWIQFDLTFKNYWLTSMFFVFCLLEELACGLQPPYILLSDDLFYSPTKWKGWCMIGFHDGWYRIK